MILVFSIMMMTTITSMGENIREIKEICEAAKTRADAPYGELLEEIRKLRLVLEKHG